MSTNLQRIETKIETIKQEILAIGAMRPGSISCQYRLPKEKRRPFYQVSYTHHMKSHSEYVRPENLAVLRKETVAFKRFKKLIEQWIDLALKASQLRVTQTTARARHRP
jgi:hypothetical protein